MMRFLCQKLQCKHFWSNHILFIWFMILNILFHCLGLGDFLWQHSKKIKIGEKKHRQRRENRKAHQGLITLFCNDWHVWAIRLWFPWQEKCCSSGLGVGVMLTTTPTVAEWASHIAEISNMTDLRRKPILLRGHDQCLRPSDSGNSTQPPKECFLKQTHKCVANITRIMTQFCWAERVIVRHF